VWWRDEVLYQIYVRSFADSNGDGVGDLPGVTSRLDHLVRLGIGGIWLSPVNPSPNADWGYDVSDYSDIHPELGTLEDLDELVREAGARGIRVLLDLVPNHSSIEHAWFRERPDFYVWADEPPNNWRSVFTRESAWRLDRQTGRYYLHMFTPQQPDLDWWNPDVREEFDNILRFWFDRGIAGFRIDVAHGIVKDGQLRDNTPWKPGDPEWVEQLASWNDHSMNRPETHDVLRRWRSLCEAYDPPRVLVGEVYVEDVDRLAKYYGNGHDELHLGFNFAFVHADLDAEMLQTVVAETERLLPDGAWPVYTASNHDAGRLATRWAEGDNRKARAALFLLLTLRGTPFLYAGDELGLRDGEVPPDRVLDIVDPPRDPCRTPIPWTPDGGWIDPWLPLLDTSTNVADQEADPDSTLNYTRRLIERRRAFVREPYESLEAPEGVWAWRRGETTLTVNLTDDEQSFDGRALEPWEAVVL
jgi:alpha-glucosidase